MKKLLAFGEEKAVIVIVHGAMEHHGRYRWLSEMWRLNGFHVIIGDLPGQGLTTRSHRGHIDSFDEYIQEVKVWIKEAESFELPIFILGHSMGGLTVIRLLQKLKIKVDGVILSSPCLGLVKYPPIPINALSVGLNWIAPELKVNNRMSIEQVTRSKEERKRAMNDSLFVTKVSVRWYRELLRAMKAAFSPLPDVPLLILQGGEDKIVDKVEVKKWFHQMDLSEKIYKEWPNAYHEIFNEPEREMIFEYAKQFLETRLKMLNFLKNNEVNEDESAIASDHIDESGV